MARSFFSHSLRILDQGGQAVGNMAVTVMLARSLSIDSFAVVATVLAIWFFFSNLQRNGVVVPYIADVPDSVDDSNAESAWFAVNVAFCTAICLMLALAGSLALGLLGEGLMYASPLVLFAGLHFFNWRVLYHRERYVAASALSLILVGLLLASAAAMYFHILPADTPSAVGIYVFSYAGAFVCGLAIVSPSIPHLTKVRSFYAEKKSLIGLMSFGAFFAYFYNNGVQLILAAFAGAIEIAAFAATRVFIGPINMVVVAVTDLERSHSARQFQQAGVNALIRSTNRTLVVMTAITTPIAIGLVFYSSEILTLLYGPKYSGFTSVAQLWVVALIPQILAIPLDIQLSVRKQGKKLLAARAAGAFAAIAALAIAYVAEGEIRAWSGVLAIGCGRLFSLLVMYANSVHLRE